MERHVCQFQTVSTEGFTPEDCASFCAPPASKTVALGGNAKGKQSLVVAGKINTIANYRTQ
jgi:hypothetical protein